MPEALKVSLADKLVQTQRYRSLLKVRLPPGWWLRGEVEHGEIAKRSVKRMPRASSAVARHLARSALEVPADIAPQYEPICVRAALAMVMEGVR